MKVGGEVVRKWEGGYKAMERARDGRGQKGGESVWENKMAFIKMSMQ